MSPPHSGIAAQKPLTQTSSAPHAAPPQHGCASRPHASIPVHVPAEQVRPELHNVPLQHGSRSSPHPSVEGGVGVGVGGGVVRRSTAASTEATPSSPLAHDIEETAVSAKSAVAMVLMFPRSEERISTRTRATPSFRRSRSTALRTSRSGT